MMVFKIFLSLFLVKLCIFYDSDIFLMFSEVEKITCPIVFEGMTSNEVWMKEAD